MNERKRLWNKEERRRGLLLYKKIFLKKKKTYVIGLCFCLFFFFVIYSMYVCVTVRMCIRLLLWHTSCSRVHSPPPPPSLCIVACHFLLWLTICLFGGCGAAALADHLYARSYIDCWLGGWMESSSRKKRSRNKDKANQPRFVNSVMRV